MKYSQGFIVLFISWILYLICRQRLSAAVKAETSRSFRRKALDSVRKRLFYTAVREKCRLSNFLYYGNILQFAALCIISLLYLATGWCTALLPVNRGLLTWLAAITGIPALRIEPPIAAQSLRSKGFGPAGAMLGAILLTILLGILLVGIFILIWR